MERQKSLLAELQSFPSYLNVLRDLEDISCTKQKLGQIMNKISDELETYDNDLETIRDYNLFTFFYSQLGEKQTASNYNEKALAKSCFNVNALILKAWIAIKSGDVYTCEKLVTEIRKLKENEMEMVIAKAEVAYMYSRLGPKLYHKAEELFEAAIEEVERKGIPIDANMVAIWKFGLTLVIRRTLNMNNLFEENKFDFTIQRLMRVYRSYHSIIDMEHADSKYKARSMVELGALMDSPFMKKEKSEQKHEDLKLLRQHSPDYYFNRALEFSDSDRFVLERCGRHFRYSNTTIDKAIDLLQRSMSIKETAFAHHHLALAMKRKLEIPRWTNNSSRGRRGHASHRRNTHRGQHGPPFKSPNTNTARCLTSSYDNRTSARRPGNEHASSPIGACGGSDTFDNAQLESVMSSLDSMTISRGSYSEMKYRQTSRRRNTHRHQYRGDGRGRARPISDMESRGKPDEYENISSSKDKRRLKNYIKSPQKITYIDGSDETEVQVIIEHLEKSFEMSENTSALYDKGLLFRALRRNNEALAVFRQCFGTGNLSLVYQANSYEQAAFCIMDILRAQDSDLDEDAKAEMNYNLQHYLTVSVEISYRQIMTSFTNMTYCWSSMKMLKDLLSKDVGNKDNLKKLGDLYSKVEAYAEANNFFHKLLEIEDNEQDKCAIITEIVRNYCKLEQYGEAIVMSELMPGKVTDEKLKCQMLLEGGFQAYSRKEFQITGLRLKAAIKQSCMLSEAPTENDETLEKFDLFILCSDSVSESSYQIKVGLEKLGLNVTVNFDDSSLFDSKSDGVVKVMNNSTHFAVFVDFETDSHDLNEMQHYTEVIRNIRTDRQYGNTVFIKRDESSKIPANHAHVHSIVYNTHIDDVENGGDLQQNQVLWFKELIELITMK